MSTLWYDRDGQPITMEQAGKLLRDPSYKRIGLTHITSASDPNIDITVSTVWLGLDHSWNDGPPMIFETMTFGEPVDEHQYRWSSLDEATQAHAECVKTIAVNIANPIVNDNYQWPKEA